MKKFLLSIFILAVEMTASAKRELTYFWGQKDAYINNQTAMTFDLVSEILQAYPPTTDTVAPARKAALYMMDGILHDARLDGSPLIIQYMDTRLQLVLDDLRKPIEKGMKIYRMYNDGVIVRTPEVTMAWDLVHGPKTNEGESIVSDSLLRLIVDKCDIMFLSHNHNDHVDPAVQYMLTSAGKPVVAPDEILADSAAVTHTRKEKIWKENFTASNGAKLKATILPGHQDHLQNNIYIVTTPDGYTFCSTGDQWHEGDNEWVLNLKGKIPAIDVLMPICWAYKLPLMVESFNPKVVITGHENELGHTADHREAYWLTYYKLEDINRPKCLMTWGEILFYQK